MASKTVCTLIVIICSICFAASDEAPFTEDELREPYGSVVYPIIVFRHGDRTPISTFPTDLVPLSYWKEGAGQLTKIGKFHEYQLGSWFRQRYQNLLPDPSYRYDRILVNSSDVERAIMSAELFLAGLYPPDEEEMWNDKNIRWQPVPVHTTPKHLDHEIYLNMQTCGMYELQKTLMNESPEFAAFFDEHRQLFEYVSAHSGMKMTKDDVCEAISRFSDIYDALFIEASNNLTLPAWALTVYPEPMKSLAAFYFSTLAYTDEMRRLKGGPLLKTIVDDLTEKAAGGLGNRTFHVYSGHDTTVAVLLDTLDIFNRIAPPYSSAVLIELRKKQEDYFVSVLYRNSSRVPPYLLKLPGCKNDVCTLDEFVQLSAQKIPENWKKECTVECWGNAIMCNKVLVILFSILLVLMTLFIIISIVRSYYRYKQYRMIGNHFPNPERVKLEA